MNVASINWSHKNSDKLSRPPHLVWVHCSAAVLTVVLGQSEDGDTKTMQISRCYVVILVLQN